MLWLDTEVFGELDIKRVGAYRWLEVGGELLLLTYALDDGPVQVWDRTADATPPADLLAAVADENVLIWAHNAAFDRNVLRIVLGWDTPIERWRCTMVQALAHSLPGSLEQLGEALGLPADQAKLKDGKKLIQRFCKPAPKNHKARRYDRTSHPAEWARFVEYALQDVEAMRECRRRMPSCNYPDNRAELELWHLDQRINDRGFQIDLDLARAAVRAADRAQALLAERVAALTGGAVGKATQRDKLMAYLAEQHGVALDGLTKSAVKDALDGEDLPPEAKALLEIRQEASRSSTAKYQTLLNATCADGRLRGGLQFCGASRTGRWAGRLFQPQNLPRPTIKQDVIALGIDAMKADCEDLLFADTMSLSSDALRGVIIAPPGKKLVVSDLSNIEGRMLAWLADEKWKLQAFRDYDTIIGTDAKGKPIRKGFDLYILAYARSFSVSPMSIGKESPERQIGKVQELALGYGGAVGAFATMGKNYGVMLPEERVLEVVRAWRSANGEIVKLWYKVEQAAVAAVRNPGHAFAAGGHLVFRADGPWLRMRLPSGRFLCYYQPAVDGDGQLTYMGIDQYTRRWTRLHTWGGKLVENATQAASRDVLTAAMPTVERAGYEIVLSVHDETVTETPNAPGDYTAKCLSELLATVPEWAEGLPLAAAGFEATRYKKE